MLLGFKILGRRIITLTLLSLMLTSYLLAQFIAISLTSWEALNVALSAGTDQTLIMEEGARSVFTSHVPLSLYESLRRYPNITACEPFTLTPTSIQNKTVIIRGASIEYLTACSKRLIRGKIPNREGPWAIAGIKAAKRLNLKVNDCVAVASPLRPTIMYLKIAGICAFGDPRDYEVLVPLPIGQKIAGLPETIVSIITVEGIDAKSLANLLNQKMKLIIHCNIDVRGWILILDSLNMPVSSQMIEGPSTLNFTLPFGYYKVAYQSSSVLSILTEVLLTSNTSINVEFFLGSTRTLKVLASKEDTVILQNKTGSQIHGIWSNGSWIFLVKPGVYTLQINDKSYEVPIFGNTTFDPKGLENVGYKVTIKVVSWNGSEVSDFLLIVEDKEGNVVTTLRELSHQVSIKLPEGPYHVCIYKSPYFVSTWIDVPKQTNIVIKLPKMISNPEKIPYRIYTSLKPLMPEEAGSYTLQAFMSLTTSYIAAAITFLLSLSVIACFVVQRHFYLSISDKIKILQTIGFSRGKLITNIGTAHLLLSLISAITSTIIAWAVFTLTKLDLILTIMGYGADFPATKTLLLTTLSVFVSWLTSILWLIKRIEEGKP